VDAFRQFQVLPSGHVCCPMFVMYFDVFDCCYAIITASYIFIHYVRVARWFVFKQKIPNVGKFWRAFE
jgi:hypothetical protein